MSQPYQQQLEADRTRKRALLIAVPVGLIVIGLILGLSKIRMSMLTSGFTEGEIQVLSRTNLGPMVLDNDPYRHGKVLILNAPVLMHQVNPTSMFPNDVYEEGGVHPAFADLPDSMRATKPENVDTLVLVYRQPIGPSDTDIDEKWLVVVYDMTEQKRVAAAELQGLAGEVDIARWVKRLPAE